jgi:hypothetical protein
VQAFPRGAGRGASVQAFPRGAGRGASGQAFPRGAWEREGFSRSHALRGNACLDAPRPAMLKRHCLSFPKKLSQFFL